MLPECALVSPDRHPAVLTERCGRLSDPVGRSLAHQLPPGCVYVSSLLVTGQSRRGRDEPCPQAAEEQCLATKVLSVEPECRCGDLKGSSNQCQWCLLRLENTISRGAPGSRAAAFLKSASGPRQAPVLSHGALGVGSSRAAPCSLQRSRQSTAPWGDP